jgi:hypothetical protein
VTRRRTSFAAWLTCCLVTAGNAFAMPSLIQSEPASIAAPDRIKLAQAQQTPAPAQPSAPQAPPAAAPTADDPIGNVATLTGSASVTRNNASAPLKLKDEIFLNDVLQTSAKASLGVTFNDSTTFNLTANARIAVDNYVYAEGGKANAALFNVAKGTVAFVAAAVAKTGDMTISTPTATLGIRGTSGLVEVPEGTSAGAENNVAVKLYPDPDGNVGRIEVNDRSGSRLGFLTQGASGFTIRPTLAGGRFTAVPLVISQQQMLRDQGFVRQVHAAQNFGRRIVTEQRALRRADPNRANPARQPGLQRQNGQRNRPGQQQPALQNRPGLQQQRGLPARAGQPGQPGLPTQPGLQRPPRAPGLQRPQGQIRPVLPRRPASGLRQKPQQERR